MNKREQSKVGITNKMKYLVDVVTLVRISGYTKSDAVTEVAKLYRVEKGTIVDALQRGIGLNAEEFNKYLAEKKLYNLRKLLVKRYSKMADYINVVFDNLVSPAEKTTDTGLKSAPQSTITA